MLYSVTARAGHSRFGRATLVAAVLSVVAATAPSALAFEYSLPTKPYYAESVMTERQRTVNVQVWYTPQKVKFQIGSGGRTMVMIGDKAAATMTMLLPDRKTYFQRPLPAGLFGPLGKTGPGKGMTFKKVGSETLLGVKTSKYKVVGKNAGGSAFDGHIWLTADNIIMRLDGKKTRGEIVSPIKMDTKVLKMGPVDAKAFAIPDGYKKMGK